MANRRHFSEVLARRQIACVLPWRRGTRWRNSRIWGHSIKAPRNASSAISRSVLLLRVSHAKNFGNSASVITVQTSVCNESERLRSEVQDALARLVALTTAQFNAFRFSEGATFMRLHKEIENAVGPKGCNRAIKQHEREYRKSTTSSDIPATLKKITPPIQARPVHPRHRQGFELRPCWRRPQC